MMIYFNFYYLISLYFFLLIISSKCEKFNKNVGTVLFSGSDLTKKCWSQDSLALLASRKAFQNLLPSEDVIDFTKEDSINDFIEYVRIILETVDKYTSGYTKHIILDAIVDTFGGYMNYFLLPATRFAYYNGFLCYNTVKKLYDLFNEFKIFLKTNGAGWASPCNRTIKLPDPKPYDFSKTSNCSKPCENLVYYDGLTNANGIKLTIIPMPFFDAVKCPTAIAVPFKHYSLRNIESKAAAYILVKYYAAAIRCLKSRDCPGEQLLAFKKEFRRFLLKDVFPRLNDDKFYAAFGGVYRLLENLNNDIGDDDNLKDVPAIQNVYDKLESNQKTMADTEDFEQISSPTTSRLILLIFLFAILVWIVLGTVYVCCRIIKNRNNQEQKLQRFNDMQQTKQIKQIKQTKQTKVTSKDKIQQENKELCDIITKNRSRSANLFTRKPSKMATSGQSTDDAPQKSESLLLCFAKDKSQASSSRGLVSDVLDNEPSSPETSQEGTPDRYTDKQASLTQCNPETCGEQKTSADDCRCDVKYHFKFDLEDTSTSLESSPRSPVYSTKSKYRNKRKSSN